MYTIYHYYNHNNLFKAGFLIGSGFAFMFCGSMFVLLGNYSVIKYGFEK